MTNSKALSADSALRISRGRYRVGSFLLFLRDDGRWQMAEPLDWDDPIGGGFRKGSVAIRSRLKDCVEAARLNNAMGRPHAQERVS